MATNSQCSTSGLRTAIEKLVGQKCVREVELPDTMLSALSPAGAGIGYSQLNELLLLLGFDRVAPAFFQFLVNGSVSYTAGAAIPNFQALLGGIDRFRELGLLLFGNIKFAFKILSSNEEYLSSRLEQAEAIDSGIFDARHEPIIPIKSIPPEDTYYLGYLIEKELRQKLAENPKDPVAFAEEAKRQAVVEMGRKNYEAYLVSDHLDVYVATSMRKKHEYVAVNQLANEIFSHEELRGLKPRWFDPTQAYCNNRIDKGLSEALMLRRAACTIYLVQEADTLGKDSELASTLAQGKPVIAFVPDIDDGYVKTLIDEIRNRSGGIVDKDELLSQLKAFAPATAWDKPTVREWCAQSDVLPPIEVQRELVAAIKKNYDDRASTLAEKHPLGLQVNLATGVANGVLVVRDVPSCAKLVKRILTRTLKFRLDEQPEAIYLREEISGCVFRVATADNLLTNAFWNFYLDSVE